MENENLWREIKVTEKTSHVIMMVIFYSFLSQSFRQVGGYFEQRGDIEQS